MPPKPGPREDRTGEKAGPYSELITDERLLAFRDAVGSRSSAVPPTFLTRYRIGEFELFSRLGIELASVLHAEQAYGYAEPIVAGDTLHYETSFTQLVEKRELSFLTFETRFESERGGKRVPIGTAKTTIVVKGANGK